MFTLFRARGLTRTAPGGGVDGEDIIVHVVPLAGLGDWLAAARARGCVIDCRLLVALGLRLNPRTDRDRDPAAGADHRAHHRKARCRPSRRRGFAVLDLLGLEVGDMRRQLGIAVSPSASRCA